ncbi:alcohol dehydrogenase catalytic domain-containing protein [Anaerosalibacter massiliensis]|uniref:Alcohol dehydrogenase catalytic domain-containing protein n=1 Tax=Anaerosalibacter massiliensis TaxID=1347392 RepID=A0A9X2MI86_9FIRM|nr:alcohol dehydrogenase catalytic domain-containing protein [Anaerosalibacter massiliensis]MCR2045652.1 alcohol dehydrogenase catalytic domain-containing protein [Anaerosalibacter massiliensis]
MRKKMKAAVMYGPNDIRIEEVEKPDCPDGGFVLKVEAVGLCGSDIRNLTTDSRKGDYPHIYGHEIVGVIDEVDPKVEEYKVGERVYIYPMAHCLKCEYCRSGHSENCIDTEDYTQCPGGFAEYISYTKKRVERGAIYRVPEGVSIEAATLAEPLSSVYACQENIDIRLGDTVVILGAGPIGIFHSLLAKLRGAEKVIMVEINDSRLEIAKKFSVDYVINSTKEDPIEGVRRITNGKGADKVISANPSTLSQQQAIFMAKKGGIVVFFGGVAGDTLTKLDTNYLHYNNIWIYGHYASNSIQVKKAFELSISDRFPSEKIITHVMPLDNINQAIELVKLGEALKVVLKP